MLIKTMVDFLFSLGDRGFSVTVLLSGIGLNFMFTFVSKDVDVPLSCVLGRSGKMVIALVSYFMAALTIVLLTLVFSGGGVLFAAAVTGLMDVVVFAVSYGVYSGVRGGGSLWEKDILL